MNERVPEGWAISNLDDAIDILSGFPFKSSEFTNDPSDFGLIRIRNLLGQELETFYSGEYSDDFVVQVGDILIGMDGDFHIVKWKSKNALLNQRICKLVPKQGGFDINFVHYFLIPELQKIHNQTTATTVKHLSVKDIREVEQAFPPLNEQKKIASILTSVDDVIETTQRQIDKLQDLKKATMNELLTKGIGHTEFKDSELGRIPKSWEVKSVSEICTDIIDCVNKTAPVVEHPTPYKMIRTTNVRYGEIDTDNVRYVSEETFKIWTRRGVLQENDIIFTREAPVGETGLVDEPNGLFLGQRTMLYRADPSQTNPHFLLFAFQSEYCKKQLEDMTGGSTVGHMRVPDCSKIKFLHCSKDEQDQISSSISSINNNILSLKRRLAQTQSLKKSLMQDLLTGKVRVQVN